MSVDAIHASPDTIIPTDHPSQPMKLAADAISKQMQQSSWRSVTSASNIESSPATASLEVDIDTFFLCLFVALVLIAVLVALFGYSPAIYRPPSPSPDLERAPTSNDESPDRHNEQRYSRGEA